MRKIFYEPKTWEDKEPYTLREFWCDFVVSLLTVEIVIAIAVILSYLF